MTASSLTVGDQSSGNGTVQVQGGTLALAPVV
jgi:hypothetical protein